jgi:hypothetical protein
MVQRVERLFLRYNLAQQELQLLPRAHIIPGYRVGTEHKIASPGDIARPILDLLDDYIRHNPNSLALIRHTYNEMPSIRVLCGHDECRGRSGIRTLYSAYNGYSPDSPEISQEQLEEAADAVIEHGHEVAPHGGCTHPMRVLISHEEDRREAPEDPTSNALILYEYFAPWSDNDPIFLR